MNIILLIFFAVPLAVIVFSIALQKILKSPFLVASIIFSVLLIIALAFFDFVFLLAVIAYTILSFITAVITRLICRCSRKHWNCRPNCNCDCDCDSDTDSDTDADADTDTDSNCGCNTSSNNCNTRNMCRWSRGRRF